MIALDKERSIKMPPTEFQKDQAQHDKNLLEKAQVKIDEEMDQVKSMNKMVFYSKVVTIRDKQLEEMKDREQDWVKEQKKLDIMMEIERLKVCQEQEDREIKKKQAQKMGAQIITNQIQERHLERIKEQEQRQKEADQMKAQAQRHLEEEIKQNEIKKERAKDMMLEVEKANKMTADEKLRKIQEEKDQDLKIAEYNQ